MYNIETMLTDGTIEKEQCSSFNQALTRAKSELGNSMISENKIINEQNGVEVWNSNNAIELNKYLEYSYDEWNNLSHGHHEERNEPSIYFDIDGTLGKWYSDAKGFTYEELLDPTNHYFRDIEPHPVMVELAKNLHEKDIDVCIISAADKNTIQDKWNWIEEHLPFVKKENICFAPLGADKSDFVKGNAENSILIDDYNKNLDEWKGTAYKAINGINSHQDKYPEIDFTKTEDTLSLTYIIGDEALVKHITENATISVAYELYDKYQEATVKGIEQASKPKKAIYSERD